MLRHYLGIVNDFTPEQTKRLEKGQISLWADETETEIDNLEFGADEEKEVIAPK
jgi:hypothetical protein